MKKYRTWVEIERKALVHNYKIFRKSVRKSTKLALVVKSNAYGHGMKGVAELFSRRADFFAVDDILEAYELRDAGITKPILVFGYTLPIHYKKAVKKDISITIASIDQLKKLIALGHPVKIHLKVDTGLHRQGISPKEVSTFLKLIGDSKVVFEGMYSHFAAAENPNYKRDIKYSERQIKTMQKVVEKVKAAKKRPIVHMSGSAGTFILKDAQFNMIRAGISLYGLWPSEDVKDLVEEKLPLKPALTWKSIVSQVKYVKKGGLVGYDLTEELNHDATLAVIPIGYWHGYSRDLSSKSYVLIRGKRAKLLGRVSMDMIVVDATGINVKEGDEVVLLGRQGKHEISAEELAEKEGTINYEIVTTINPTIPRLFI